MYIIKIKQKSFKKYDSIVKPTFKQNKMNSLQLSLLSQQSLDIKKFINWNQTHQTQQLTITLQQLKSQLQRQLSQSIESHCIGKQKNFIELEKSLTRILEIKQRSKEMFEVDESGSKENQQEQKMNNGLEESRVKKGQELDCLVQLIHVKNCVDYCLEKLQPIVNNDDQLDEQQEKKEQL